MYLFTALAIFLLSLLVWKKRRLQKPALFMVVVWLIMHDGFRWEIGTDWDPYYEFFLMGENEHMGFLYSWINESIRRFTSNYTVLVLLIAVLTYTTFASLFKKYSPNAIMSMLIYYCIMMGTLGSNRQILAMVVCVVSLRFIVERRFLWFALAMGIAVSLHVTAALFFPAYFIYGKQISNKAIIIVIIASFILGLLRVINRIPFLEYLAVLDSMGSGSSLTIYVDQFDNGVSIMGALKRMLFVFLAVCVRNRVNNSFYDYFLVLYSIGCVIFLLFNGSVVQIMAGRGAVYYNIFETIVIPFMLLNLPVHKTRRVALWCAFFVLYYYLMWRDMDYYLIASGIDIYRPYKCIFF